MQTLTRRASYAQRYHADLRDTAVSVRISTIVWEHSAAVGNARLVLLALADHADDDGVCWPGVARVEYKTLLSRRTVQRALRELERIGELATVQREGHSSVYQLFPGGVNLTLRQGDAAGGVNLTQGGASPVTPEPSVETSPEPNPADHGQPTRAKREATPVPKPEPRPLTRKQREELAGKAKPGRGSGRGTAIPATTSRPRPTRHEIAREAEDRLKDVLK